MPSRALRRFLAPLTLFPVALVGCHADSVGDSRDGEDAATDSGGGGDVTIDPDIGGDLDGRPPGDSTTDTTSATDTRTGDAPGDAPPIDAGTCGTIYGGPAMVNLGAYCMDVSEVTNRQYNAFLAAKVTPQSDSKSPAKCSFNKSYGLPVNETDTLDVPRTIVDWCDAYAFCEWSGKRLCGKIGGGENDTTDYMDPTKSEWFAACQSGDAAGIYPYGSVFDVTKCNVDFNPLVTYATTYPGCHGTTAPWSGVYDLSGSVLEWEGSCDDVSLDGTDQCHLRGGSIGFPGAKDSRCDNPYTRNRQNESADITVGFRCCKTP